MSIELIYSILFITATLLISIVLYLFLKRQFNLNIQQYKQISSNLKIENDHLKTKIQLIEKHTQAIELEKFGLERDFLNLEKRNNELIVEINQINTLIVETETLYHSTKIGLTEKDSEINHLENKLTEQKSELENLNKTFQTNFENLANKILEEKSSKFTKQNQENLNQILQPFQEKLADLKKTVYESYEKENKQRFSLAEKVKELSELNIQISNDAKKLTKALKSESKTQGNWGEMILENILEKSGLVKGREYFMEHQLTDDDNLPLRGEDSGKKMRPDAVIKYPGDRDIIIDSKVSLTAFLDTIDEDDDEIVQIKLDKHIQSIKNHIQQLSQKAYDEHTKTLDFVMMFIPSEAAYIAAMQHDPNLWGYAYDKRVLLLNPSNLITSLKLVADLWKRDYQNKNAMEIADRGAKLYDKFVGFVQNLENVGKNLNKANESYHTAYNQLSLGRDNLIRQTEKLKDLGIKNRKTLSASLSDNFDNSEDVVE